MYNLAIIEDESIASDKLVEFIKQFGENKGVKFNITVFPSALRFLGDYKSQFDLVFMDIELPDINGMEASRRIREINKDVVIIFITNLARFAVEGYSVNAFDFIVKPVEYGNFEVRFSRAIDYVAARSKKIIIRPSNSVAQTMPVSDVKFIEVFGHNLVYHTHAGDFTERKSMAEAENALKGSGFYKCSNCYLVNLKYVERIEDTSVTVAGETLAISRRKKKEFMEALTRFFGEGV